MGDTLSPLDLETFKREARSLTGVSGTRISERFDALIAQASIVSGVPAPLLKAVVSAESNYNPSALSPKGALGLMQLMPATARELGVHDRANPIENVLGGARYLAQMHEKFGDWTLAVAAYNAGPGAVGRSGGVPNNKETPNYVRTVAKRYRSFAGDSVDAAIMQDFERFTNPSRRQASPTTQLEPMTLEEFRSQVRVETPASIGER